MDKKFTPLDNTNEFPYIDKEIYTKFFKTVPATPQTSIETFDFLATGLSISPDTIHNQEKFIRNYVYCTVIARNHLLEIDNRLKEIKERKKRIHDSESYPFRKLIYFEKKNEEAKQQIIHFLCYEIIEFISDESYPNRDMINRNDEENMWIFGPTYDYQYNSQYYSPDYDFSTFAKFYNIPNIPLIDFMKNIEETMALKSNSIYDYYSRVKETIENNNLLSKMVERVSKNYHMHHRKELFESLFDLFNEQKYLAFVVNATLQLEGMFHELISIKHGKKEKQGTLIEKVDKAFQKNQVLKQTLYPYFAFDVPDLRNQVAHKGLVENDNIEMLAHELLLDLNCIVSLVENESIDKYKTILLIREKLNAVDSDNYSTDKEYYEDISKILLHELYANDKMNIPFFWEILTNPKQFEDELNYYIPASPDNSMIYLKDVVYAVSGLVKKEVFWKTALQLSDKITTKDNTELNDKGIFLNKLKNMFIAKLDGNAKKLCCQLNAKIQECIKKEQ